ncbi:PREDICTED: uncharacterized protein LOC106101541 [Papilio polytes]|uniref:uncharacterized protein LOC106101541 n=1 Tax=Papilio polytes TaxID=76194 RepID=UPI00067686E7|nr:PREDICTED: uncharacterized protein LOC106101541 [Papilio polytes]
MIVKHLVPRNFLCYFPLKTGALFVGVFMSCIALTSCIVLLVQVCQMDDKLCQKFVWRTAFSFHVIAVIYNVIIIVINLILIWAVLKSKRILLLCWVIVTDVWLAQMFLLLIVLLCIYSLEVSLAAWILSTIFGLLAIGILIYLSMIVFGYWIETKGNDKSIPVTINDTS